MPLCGVPTFDFLTFDFRLFRKGEVTDETHRFTNIDARVVRGVAGRQCPGHHAPGYEPQGHRRKPSFNTYTPGVANGVGLNNIGLLIQTWGKVTYVDSSGTYFYVDDGGGLQDGSGQTGMRVALDNLATGVTINPPLYGDIVGITAISSTIAINNLVQPNLRPRRQSDIDDYTAL